MFGLVPEYLRPLMPDQALVGRIFGFCKDGPCCLDTVVSTSMYRVLADMVLLTHAAFVLFVVLGGLLVIRWPRIAPWHLAALAWGAIVIGLGWVCPLTPLENMLRLLAGQGGYRGGFIDHYIAMVIYPAGLTRDIQVVLAAALIIGNAIVYGRVLRRRVRKS